VSFSPTFFVSGTKLLVKNGSPIRSFRDLAGKKVAVTAGTTNEKAMRELAREVQDRHGLTVANDHAASFALLTSGAVDAFASDDVLLYGLLAQNRLQGEYRVVGEFLSYDPYALMFRKGDAAFAAVVHDAFHASPTTTRSSGATPAGSCAGCPRASASTCRWARSSRRSSARSRRPTSSLGHARHPGRTQRIAAKLQARRPRLREPQRRGGLPRSRRLVRGARIDHDMYGEGELVEGFERKIAALLGKAAAMFAPSGVMAQLAAVKIWTEAAGVARFGMHPPRTWRITRSRPTPRCCTATACRSAIASGRCWRATSKPCARPWPASWSSCRSARPAGSCRRGTSSRR
jgi:hypothetical protein